MVADFIGHKLWNIGVAPLIGIPFTYKVFPILHLHLVLHQTNKILGVRVLLTNLFYIKKWSYPLLTEVT